MHTTRCIMRPRCLLWVHTIQISIGLLLRPERESKYTHDYESLCAQSSCSRLCFAPGVCPARYPLSAPSLGVTPRPKARAPAAQKSNLQPDRLRRSVNTGDRSVIRSAHCSHLIYVCFSLILFGN
jgi:hypothetical protein